MTRDNGQETRPRTHAAPDAAPAGVGPQARDSTPIVRLVNVHKAFGRLRVLDGVNLAFQRGRTTVVLGPSGSGKSVMLKHIVGLLRPDEGEVWFEQTRIDGLSEERLGPIRRRVGFLFQQSALFDSMNVAENIRFPMRELTDMRKAEIDERVHEVLVMVGLEDSREKMPADLSGGQRKRIALARAIVLRPQLVLYDEPTTGLDPIRADVINELILRLQRELHATSIVVTHDLASAFKVADHMVMLYDGRILLEGPPETFRESRIPIIQHFLSGEATDEELAGITGGEPGESHGRPEPPEQPEPPESPESPESPEQSAGARKDDAP
jgi:phospholipid/cholesterol/gamma-HCH transport system ATP-binding protein